MTNTPACDREPAQAHAVNVDATRHLVELAKGIRFVFLPRTWSSMVATAGTTKPPPSTL